MKIKILSLLCAFGLVSVCVFGLDDSGTSPKGLKNPNFIEKVVIDMGRYIDLSHYFGAIVSISKSDLKEDESLRAINAAAEPIERSLAMGMEDLSRVIQKMKGEEDFRELVQKLSDRMTQNEAEMESYAKEDIMEAKKGNLEPFLRYVRVYERVSEKFDREITWLTFMLL